MAYATVVELRARLDKTAVTDDTILGALLDAASQAVDNCCNRPDGFIAAAVASARYFVGRGVGHVLIDECAAISQVAVKESVDDTTYTAWLTADWVAFTGDYLRPNFNRTPYTGIMVEPGGNYASFLTGIRTVRVTAQWGYALTAPYVVKEATIIEAARWYKRGQTAWSDAVGQPETGMLYYRKEIDPDVRMMLVQGRLVRMAV